jgi:beta-xylosidase
MMAECVYRSKSPLGPFEAPPDGVNPVIFNDNHPDIQNTGHMDLIEGDDGKWIAVFLGVRPVFEAKEVSGGAMGMPTHLGRESFMAPVEWIDGWPVVNSRKPIELIGQAEGLTLTPEVTSFIDEFDQKGESRYSCSKLIFRSRHQLVPSPGTVTRLP